MDERFGKEYKLCSKKIIDLIFKEGKVIKSYPFMVRYIFTELDTPKKFQIVISVPKSRFKKAVDRNRMRRLIKEAVRKKKHILETSDKLENKQIALFLIYSNKEKESYHAIVNKIEALFLRLTEEIK